MPAPPPDTRTKDNEALPDLPRKGRGSVSNRPSHRFGVADRYEIDDGWSDHEREDWGKARRQTILGVDTVRRIITRNTSPDVGFDRSINPYKGCEHGCICHPVTHIKTKQLRIAATAFYDNKLMESTRQSASYRP